jgi:hypothetical protein
MMEAARTSEMLVNFYQITWHYSPEDSHLHTFFVVSSEFHGVGLVKIQCEFMALNQLFRSANTSLMEL